jgi:hypothetical protein
MNLGNCYHLLQLRCPRCGWAPPPDMKMEGAELHFTVGHDTDQLNLELVPACPCGGVMEHTSSSPTGGGTKAYLRCGNCGNTGHLIQRDQDVPGV